MKPPKVSVLVPVYNGEPFLVECLDSILAQDFADMEILIADDGSTDGSVALVQRYAAREPRIRWWKNERNLGLAANFNCCLRAARGEYIKYVLQDDKLLKPDTVRRMVQKMEGDAAVVLVATASQSIDASSKLLDHRTMFTRAGVWGGWNVISKCFEIRGNPIGEPTVVMFRRQQGARGFNVNFHYLIDLEMWLYLLRQGNLAYIPEQLCAFRKHSEQESVACMQAGALKTEYPKLLNLYAGDSGLIAACSRQAIFANIYYLRKWCPHESSHLLTRLRKELGGGWYALYYFKHKVTRPFKKLKTVFRRFAVQCGCLSAGEQ